MIGKQLIYHALQDSTEALSLDDLAAMDRDIASLREAVTVNRANEKVLRGNLSAVNATQSMEQLRETISTIEQEKTETSRRLGLLRQGNVRLVLPRERLAAEEEWRVWKARAENRRKMGIELWEMCTEEVPEGKTKTEIWVRVSTSADALNALIMPITGRHGTGGDISHNVR